MTKKNSFTGTEQRVIRAMCRLNRFATANEIAKWADNMSWNTSNKVLMKLVRKKIVKRKVVNGKLCWRMEEFD